MGWGILDDPKYPNIPGTVNLNEKVDACMCTPRFNLTILIIA
jgi:hypothetical protein